MKKIISSLLILVFHFNISSQTTGPNNPSSGTEESAGCLTCTGCEWSNFNNAFTNDGLNTSANLSAYPGCFQSSCYTSRILYVNDFGFNIPLTATIVGIKAEIKRSAGALLPALKDDTVKLITSVGNLVGQNKKSAAYWTNTSNYVSYGSASDLWATVWSPAAINSSDFGLALAVNNFANSVQTANVDHVRMTIYYSTGVGIAEASSEPAAINLYYDASGINIVSNKHLIAAVKIYDEAGKIVLDKEIKNLQAKINTEALPKGIYFVNIIGEENKLMSTRKIILQ